MGPHQRLVNQIIPNWVAQASLPAALGDGVQLGKLNSSSYATPSSKIFPPPVILFVAFVAFVTCATPAFAQSDPPSANFHHVHLNVTDPAETVDFYTRIFGAVPIEYANTTAALFTERSFILWNKVDDPPSAALNTGLWHIGWGAVDVPNRYEWLKEQGVKIHTPLYPLNNIHVTYVQGPDGELIEVNTMPHHRFAHVHLFAEDVNETVAWYRENLGVQTRRDHVPKPDLTQVRAWSNGFHVDNISFIVYGAPDYTPAPPWWNEGAPFTECKSTKGHAIDHIAFSYRDIEPVYQRMNNADINIIKPMIHDPEFNHTSFFVEGPDKVLIEIVQAKPIPEGIWDE